MNRYSMCVFPCQRELLKFSPKKYSVLFYLVVTDAMNPMGRRNTLGGSSRSRISHCELSNYWALLSVELNKRREKCRALLPRVLSI